MRILVMSDCHGAQGTMEKVLQKHGDIKKVFFLGDGVTQVEEVMHFFPDRDFKIVSGNCDWDPVYPSFSNTVVEGVKILFTHGHRFGVKGSRERLFEMARAMGATLVLYGHTHIADVEYRDGIYMVNPGALNGSRNGPNGYAIIDITSAGIMPSLMKI